MHAIYAEPAMIMQEKDLGSFLLVMAAVVLSLKPKAPKKVVFQATKCKVFFLPIIMSFKKRNVRFWFQEKLKSELRVERMRARTTHEATLSLCLVFVRLFRELEGAAAGGILLWGREGGKGGGGERGKPEGGIFFTLLFPPLPFAIHTHLHRQVPRAFILKS